MHMHTHPCAQATVKIELDREIESSKTEMETDEETFETQPHCVTISVSIFVSVT